MIAHILCPGPSLPRTWKRLGFGPSIAVNRAIDFTCCDWLVAGDACTFDRIVGRPLQGVCSMGAVLRDQLPPRFKDLDTQIWEDLYHGPGDPPQWGVQAAICLALARWRIHRVALFGVDHAGTDDWDATPAADDRSPARWAREAADLARTIAYLHELQIPVERITA